MPPPSWRWKARILTVVLGTLVVGVIMGKRLWVAETIHVPLQQRAAAISAELRSRGVRVGEPEVVSGVTGVEQAVALDIDGQKVHLLEFDPSKDAEAAELRRVHEQHTTRVLGTEQPAEDELGIVIVDFEHHPQKEQILKSFHNAVPGR
jgi:hypothetical protein